MFLKCLLASHLTLFRYDDTGLFFNPQLHNKSLTFCGDPYHGGTKSKQQATVLLAHTADSTDELPPLQIGIYEYPHCFRWQLVEVLHYKLEGRGFNSQWCQWNFFYWHYPSSPTMALGLTQLLTEMSTRKISWGVKVASA